MGLLVLVLRSYLVFQNVYVTYKTLKAPPPSSRNNGKPSVRAMTQRKRDMKGCMAIWIVWCCLAAYESVVEGFISIFVPFYNEIKSVVLLLFILARARGAEPVYLHVIRPFLKPYVATLDAILDVCHNVGDFILLLVSAPFRGVLSWWRRRYSIGYDKVEVDSDQASDQSDAPPPYQFVPQSNGTVRSGRLDETISKFYTTSHATATQYQVWQPPTSSYAENGHVRMPEPSIPPPLNSEGPHRAYPAFPSAYPTTHPMPTAMNNTDHGYSYSSDDDDDVRSGFRQSLLQPRELFNPSSGGGLSDDVFSKGVQIGFLKSEQDTLESDTENNLDSFYESDEDSFNVTLRTPLKPIQQPSSVPVMARSISIATEATVASSTTLSDEAECMTEESGLSTIRNATTLRTVTSRGSITTTTTTTTTASNSSALGRQRGLPASRQAALSRNFNLNLPSESRGPSTSVPHGPARAYRITVQPTLGEARKGGPGGQKDPLSMLSKRQKITPSTSRAQNRTLSNVGASKPAGRITISGKAGMKHVVSTHNPTQAKITSRRIPNSSRLPQVLESGESTSHINKPMRTQIPVASSL